MELVSLNDVFKGTDAILLVTDHDVFSSLNFSAIKKQVRTPIIIDGRNFFLRTTQSKGVLSNKWGRLEALKIQAPKQSPA